MITRERSLIATLGLIGTLLIAPAGALSEAEMDSLDLFDVPLEEVLEMEVSTASKLGGKADMAPGNLVVITQEDIRRYGYRTLAEALERVVGFVSNDLGFASSVGFRGLTPTHPFDNARILYLIDGLRYNEFVYDTAQLSEAFPLDIESIDRIEVLKGAGSAIWGTNALYAVVNVISKDADSNRSRQVMGEYGSNNRKKGYASYGDTTEGGFKYYTSASVTNAPGDTSVYYPAYDDPSTSNGIVDSPLDNKGMRASFKGEYNDAYVNVGYGIAKTDVNPSVDYQFEYPGSDDYEQEHTRAEVGYKGTIAEEQNGELFLRAYYTNHRALLNVEEPGYEDPANTYFFDSITAVRSVGSEARYAQDIFDSLRALVGVQVDRTYRDKYDSYSGEITPGGSFVPDTELHVDQSFDRTDKSAFFDFEYAPLDRVSFFFGGRWDKPTGLDAAFGPRASVVGKATEDMTVKLLYSQGFRNPTIGEGAINPVAPQQLDPEKIKFYELMVEQRFGDWGSVVASVFYNDRSDDLVFLERDDFNDYYTNTKGLTSKGAELSGTARFNETIRGYFNFSYTEAKNKDGLMAIRTTPAYMARSGLSFTVNDMIIASPEVLFGSSTKSDLGDRFGSYWISNLTLLSAPVNEGLSVSASVHNLFDQEFKRYSTGLEENARSFENGRQYRIQTMWRF